MTYQAQRTRSKEHICHPARAGGVSDQEFYDEFVLAIRVGTNDGMNTNYINLSITSIDT